MIPQAGSIMIALVENTGKLARELFVDNALGYDIDEFNTITTNKWAITLEDEPVFLSKPIEAFTFDFCNFQKINMDKKILNTLQRKDFIFNTFIPLITAFEEETGLDVKISGMPYIRTLNAQNIVDEIGIFVISAILLTSLIFFLFFCRNRLLVKPLKRKHLYRVNCRA